MTSSPSTLHQAALVTVIQPQSPYHETCFLSPPSVPLPKKPGSREESG
uniref:Uncharacterized protein n=1 Tax=Faecalibaculum rodentium TaxID=1702221 RepID=A0A140DYP8_9FIRM|nr:hypothetical protein AALO17_26410 [Faecalibaculum rodentium]